MEYKMVKKVTRIDRAGSFMTTFYLEDSVSGKGADIHVPIDQADSYETTIKAASWATLINLFNLKGETVIKT